jgi:alpha-D-ribose 1-methylphosphonate 5-triphosphate synthase subunit PhnI
MSEKCPFTDTARADTGFFQDRLLCVAGFRAGHPTVGELRTGYVALEIPYLFDNSESIYLGEILISEVECF